MEYRDKAKCREETISKRVGGVEMRLGDKWTLGTMHGRKGHCGYRGRIEIDLMPSIPGPENPHGEDESS